ncbi:phosphopyruvate hydratase [Candidatus Lariskella endosymbiont of Hedychridium roseum]|uniref:phosphopyruvate hydratase n=1 Tax=Candidatus Lariskella endosymbiont of Hedychridium roseum TaxID=3077949 RepID=UPI0030D3EF99
MKVIDIFGREILDSRGEPTLEVDLMLEGNNFGRASVPSGASLGSKEALEKRDAEDQRYGGRGVCGAVQVVNTELLKYISGREFVSQRELDNLLIELDGTINKSRVGANSTLAISLAFAKARAAFLGKMLFESIEGFSNWAMPRLMLNILNGGVHADNGITFQEFMIIPASSFSIAESLELSYRVFIALKSLLKSAGFSVGVGDEGGFAPELGSIEHALDFIMNAIEVAGFQYSKDVEIGLDVAANELYNGRKYVISKNLELDSLQMIDYYKRLLKQYPIISIEDPLAEEDLDAWAMMTSKLGKNVQIVGDDLFVTNVDILREGVKSGLANAVLIKMNQIGTLSETLDTINLARKSNYHYIVSHRSGETEDASMSHLAVATSSHYIKAGSVCRTDRICKYNELLRINEKLSGDACVNK